MPGDGWRGCSPRGASVDARPTGDMDVDAQFWRGGPGRPLTVVEAKSKVGPGSGKRHGGVTGSWRWPLQALSSMCGMGRHLLQRRYLLTMHNVLRCPGESVSHSQGLLQRNLSSAAAPCTEEGPRWSAFAAARHRRATNADAGTGPLLVESSPPGHASEVQGGGGGAVQCGRTDGAKRARSHEDAAWHYASSGFSGGGITG